jgi:hypothetical protein
MQRIQDENVLLSRSAYRYGRSPLLEEESNKAKQRDYYYYSTRLDAVSRGRNQEKKHELKEFDPPIKIVIAQKTSA